MTDNFIRLIRQVAEHLLESRRFDSLLLLLPLPLLLCLLVIFLYQHNKPLFVLSNSQRILKNKLSANHIALRLTGLIYFTFKQLKVSFEEIHTNF